MERHRFTYKMRIKMKFHSTSFVVLLIIGLFEVVNLSAQTEYQLSEAHYYDIQETLHNSIFLMPGFETRLQFLSKTNLISSDLCTLTVKAESTMSYLWIFKQDQNDTLITEDATEYSRILPADTYELITGFKVSKHRFRFIYKNNIKITSDTTISIKMSEANRETRLSFLREDSTPLHINSLGFKFLCEANGSGLNQVHLNLDSTVFIFHYNDLPDYFINSWLIKGKQLANNGNLYLINNYLYESVDDTLLANDPQNFSFADFHYHFADSIEQAHTEIQVLTSAPGFHYSQNDPRYYLPVHLRVYQDTSADFSLYQSRFSQSVNNTRSIGGDLKTAEMRIGINNVIGYFTPDEYDEPFILSEQKTVHFGMTPTYWYGRFENERDTIKIRSPFGFIKAHQLFLSQTNDVLRQFPIQIQITSNNTVISDTMIYPIYDGTASLDYGYNVDDLTFQTEALANQVIIRNEHSEVAKHPASTVATAVFNLESIDRNPPFLKGFQILSDRAISNILCSDAQNIIRLIAKDDHGLKDVKLFYAAFEDTLWKELVLEKNPPYMQTDIPDLVNGYYSIKIFLTDSSLNTLETEMAPAFHMGELTSIKSKAKPGRCETFQLFQGYPNPFNSSIQFKYSIPLNYKDKIDVSIYNLLGQKVCTLLNEKVISGSYQIKWDATDSNRRTVSSGLYFIQMKGGGFKKTQKILLIK